MSRGVIGSKEYLEGCDLHERTPYAIHHVSMSQLSVARHFGMVKFNGDVFIYFKDEDVLVRDDVLVWKKDQEKAEAGAAAGGAEQEELKL